MGLNVFEKVVKEHTVSMNGGQTFLHIDQTLTQDATGTLAFLQFEALGIPRVRTSLSVSYVDHNMLQTGCLNADDHDYLRSAASHYGVLYSKAGNGICHQVHLERYAKPGHTLLGSDSHTPNAGGMGMLAIGAGGLDIALSMAGMPFPLDEQQVIGVCLKNELSPWCCAKDVILWMLSEFGVKGGVGKVMEYFGEGVGSLSVPQRATIANMGAELGATTSIFPSDGVTRKFLKSQGRQRDWTDLIADNDAGYSKIIDIDLSEIEPMIAKPSSPGNVKRVSDISGMAVDQVCIGSCTNSSFEDLKMASALLDSHVISPKISLTVSPGSRQTLMMLSGDGSLSKLIRSGARILECACGPCIGMGQSPKSGGVSLRTFNRNFEGRSGTSDAKIYLCGVETAVASAINGRLTDPRTLGRFPDIKLPKKYDSDSSMIIAPRGDEIIRGPNIKPIPRGKPLPKSIKGKVLIRLADDVSTDHILPAGARFLPLRSNIPAISEYVFESMDNGFAKRARKQRGGFIVAGKNYGQGSSREHAAMAPMHLGIKAVFAMSFARIHRSNLINFGILPLIIGDEAQYEVLAPGSKARLPNVLSNLKDSGQKISVEADGISFEVAHDLTQRQKNIIISGGLLNHARLEIGKKEDA